MAARTGHPALQRLAQVVRFVKALRNAAARGFTLSRQNLPERAVADDPREMEQDG